ncbi:RmlC-like cupin domain-containing protein [Pilobolus umbonatus]|nr:RmlC-like cupin domain-containing protein [Pilobolus umbonatus]
MSPPNVLVNINDYPSHNFRLKDLIQSIHGVLGDGGLDSSQINANKIIELMEFYSAHSDDWNEYTLFDHSRPYTRNLIDDGNGKFNLMVLAWSKGQKSPIHDHAGSHCVMKVLDGQLQETLFEYPSSSGLSDPVSVADITDDSVTSKDEHEGQPLVVSRNTVYHPNQVTYVHDTIGLHRISNHSSEKGAVSLHLYTPPYKACKTFEEKTGRARSSGICTYYSIGGTRISQ